MTSPEDWLLDVVHFDAMAPGRYARVHLALHPVRGDAYDPCEANPASRARFALRATLARGAPDRAMAYFASTPAGALFEALLRDRACHWHPTRPKTFWADASVFAGWCLSFADLHRPVDVLNVGLPDRARIVTPGSPNEARWRELLSTGEHADTHAAAAAVYDQVTHAGLPHGGLTWPSVQHAGAQVYLLYQPPYDPADWTPGATIALDTPAGQQAIADWLLAAGYTWLGDPAVGLRVDPGVL